MTYRPLVDLWFRNRVGVVMADWRGKKPKKSKPVNSETDPVIRPIDSPATRSPRDKWKRKRAKQGDSQPDKTALSVWDTIPINPVNWPRISHRSKLAVGIVTTLALVVSFVILMRRYELHTHVGLVAPTTDTGYWLSATPYATSAKNQLDSINNRYVVLDKELAWWDSESDIDLRFGGPDKSLAVIWMSVLGVSDLDDEGNLCAYILPGVSSAFISKDRFHQYPLQSLLDRICKFQKTDHRRVLVIIDAHKLELPTNLGLLQDRFAESVNQLYSSLNNDSLYIVVSHGPGQRNWAAPEFGSSIFSFYARCAVSGDADKNMDKNVSFLEFQNYVTSNVSNYVQTNLKARQMPMFLVPERANDFDITKCKPKTKNYSLLTAKEPKAEEYKLDEKWEKCDSLLSASELNEHPILIARAQAVLSRMELLCSIYRYDVRELTMLNNEWEAIANKLDDEAETAKINPVISLAEAEWVNKNSDQQWLPDDELKNSFWKDVWVYSISNGDLDQSAKPLESVTAPSGNQDPSQTDSRQTNGENAGAAAQVNGQLPATNNPNPSIDEKKAEKEKLYKLTMEKAQQKPWYLPWLVFEGFANHADAISKQQLDRWLGELKGELPGADGVGVKNLIEIRFLQLLCDNVDWWSPDSSDSKTRDQCVQAAVRCRQLSERFAIKTDWRVRSIGIIETKFEAIENDRRMAEDSLLANQFDKAKKGFENVNELLANLETTAQDITRGLRLRDLAAREAPQYASLIGRLLLRQHQSVDLSLDKSRRRFLAELGDMQNECKSLFENGFELSKQLENLLNEGEWSDVTIKNDLGNILDLKNKIEISRDNLQNTLRADCRQIIQHDQTDVDTFMYCGDLLICPLIDAKSRNRLRELRERYIPNPPSIIDVGNQPVPTGPTRTASTTEATSPQLEQFMRDVQASLSNERFRVAEQTLIRNGLFADRWKLAMIHNNAIDAILRKLDTKDSAQDLFSERLRLFRDDYWVRTAASCLAEQMARADQNHEGLRYTLDQSESAFDDLSAISTELDNITESLLFQSLVVRILDDFWGIKFDGGNDSYFHTAADLVQKRIKKEQEFQVGKNLKPIKEQRVDADKKFVIVCDEYSYDDKNGNSNQNRHTLAVRASDQLKLQGIVTGQIQRADMTGLQMPQIDFESVKDAENSLDDGAVVPLRRMRFSFKLSEMPSGLTNTGGIQQFDIPAEILKDFGGGYMDAVVAFRGHLKNKKFLLKPIEPGLPEQTIPTFSIVHDPISPLHPEIRVDGDISATTDVVFVLDCSGSMSDPYEGKSLEGSSLEESNSRRIESGRLNRMDVLKSVFKNMLESMKKQKAFSVGIVAIGSRANYNRDKDGKGTREDDVIDPQLHKIMGIKPGNDVMRLQGLSSITDWGNLAKSVHNLQAWGQTPLYEGLFEAKEMLYNRKNDNNKVIVIISDGVDEATNHLGNSLYSIKELRRKYQELGRQLNEKGIIVQFVGFQINNSQATQDQKDRLRDEFDTRLSFVKDLAGRERSYFPSNQKDLESNLQKINDEQIPRFDVLKVGSRRPLAEKIDLNTNWEFVSNNGFDAGQYVIRIGGGRNNIEAPIWLEGGESVKLKFEAGQLSFPSCIDKIKQTTIPSQGKIENYRVERLDIQRANGLLFKFAFENRSAKLFSYRPQRLCLQVIPGGQELGYVIQDFDFISQSSYWIPVAQFVGPELEPGSYKLRLWYQYEYEESFPAQRLQLPAIGDSTKTQIKIDDKVVEVEMARIAEPQSSSQLVKVKLFNATPELLRSLLVNTDYDHPNDGRSHINRFSTQRQFAEDGSFVEHVFKIANNQIVDSKEIEISLALLQDVFKEQYLDFDLEWNPNR